MNALHREKKYLCLIESKQYGLRRDIKNNENQQNKIKLQMTRCQGVLEKVKRQIKNLTPEGTLSRADIYKKIRKQGALLTEQQLVIQEINQLENELQRNVSALHDQRIAMGLLDKKHYKFTYYMKMQRQEYIRRCETHDENENQEMVNNGRKNFTGESYDNAK